MPSGLIVICGPTATGKSSLAIALAQRLQSVMLQSVILSADSRACYQEFDIGTAKPTWTERQKIPHYLIDFCSPTQTLTLAEYQWQAQGLITQFHAQGLTPLLVGGTGLYIRSIVQGLKIPRVPPQADLRSQLQSLGQFQLYEFLQQIDPASAQRIHGNDQTRTIRALEVFYVTGKPLSAQQGENPPDYPILQIGIDCSDSQTLTDRIRDRTRKMLETGLVQEVETLCRKYGTDLPLLATLGYQEIKQYLMGEISLAEAEEQIVLHTRQFAKRQRTWFRADPGIQWLDANSPNLLEQVWDYTQQFRENCAKILSKVE